MVDVFNPKAKVILLMILCVDLVSSMPKNKRRKKVPHMNSPQRPLLKVYNFSRTHLQLSHPTNRRTVRLLSANGLYLQVNKNLTPVGSFQVNSRADFEIQSIATSIVRLINISTKRYLSINQRGRLKLQRHPDDDSLFKEVAEENFFHSFASHKYYRVNKHDVFIAIKSNGDIKPPRITRPGQKAVMFLYLGISPTPLTRGRRK